MTTGRVSGITSWVVRILLTVGFTAAVVLLLAWLAGSFHAKVGDTSRATDAPAGRPLGNARLVEVKRIRVPSVETAVGTIRAVHEAALASKILAKVTEVNVQAGQAVKLGEVLARLDDEDLTARLRQADAAVAAARAHSEQAQVELDRVRKLIEQNAAAQIELDRAEAVQRAAAAELDRAEQARRESQTMLSYATIRSPLNGVVVDKRIEVGDTVAAGQVVLTLYDPTRMQLVATVRESLTQRLVLGQDVDVHVDALDKTCTGRVSEIVPEAESASRSFLVKVTGPCPPDIVSGMFGRLLIPLGEEEVLAAPRAAVRRVGQLDLVEVADGSSLRRRVVQLGRPFDEMVEVLAGLREGEQVAIPAGGGATESGQ